MGCLSWRKLWCIFFRSDWSDVCNITLDRVITPLDYICLLGLEKITIRYLPYEKVPNRHTSASHSTVCRILKQRAVTEKSVFVLWSDLQKWAFDWHWIFAVHTHSTMCDLLWSSYGCYMLSRQKGLLMLVLIIRFITSLMLQYQTI